MSKKNKKENNGEAKKGFKGLLTAGSVQGLILRILIMLVIPYGYLMLCGLVFDKWLRLYSAVTFIFYSLIALYVVAIILSICAIVWYNKAKKAKA